MMNELSPRRILMTVDTLGGVWTYAVELARSLAPHGVEVVFAQMGAPLSREQRAEVADCVELFESPYRLEWMDDPWADVNRAADWLLEIASATQPDIVHLNGYAHGALPWGAPVLMVAHSCVLSWWNAVKGEEAPPRYDEYQARVAQGLAAADYVVAPSAAMLGALCAHYGPLARSRVIYNARDRSRFTPAVKQARVIAAGRLWDDAKNVATLDAAAPRVRWPIQVAGECDSPDGTHTWLRHVQALGKLPPTQMEAHLAASAIYALPARYEPFGLSALEAGLCGCALVLGDIPSLREVWGDAAVFVDPDDARALATALNFLIDHPEQRFELGRAARARALHYSPTRMAEKYLSAYRACLVQQGEEAVA